MNISIRRTYSLVVIFSLTYLLSGSTAVDAYQTLQSWSEIRDQLEESDEGEGVDEDDVEDWRRRSRGIRRNIDDLDDDPVINLPIPILFGVTVDDLFPNFGDPRGGGTRLHEGLDILVPRGTPIVSPTEAVVIRTGNGGSSGLYVTTANPGDETYVYMHLDEIADIDEGDELDVGDVIGYVGNTGNAIGGPAHLHFELREGRQETDPIERLTRVFDIDDKMEYLENVLADQRNDDDYIEFLVEEFTGEFFQAIREGVEVPDEILDELNGSSLSTGASAPVRDLTIGDVGDDVRALQSLLIIEGYLDISTPTGYFGPLTQSALSAFQRANGIEPASGYYGPITRSFINRTTSDDDIDEMTREELLERIQELTELIEDLQAQINALQS